MSTCRNQLPDASRVDACVKFCRQFPTDVLLHKELVYLEEGRQVMCDKIEGFLGLVAVKTAQIHVEERGIAEAVKKGRDLAAIHTEDLQPPTQLVDLAQESMKRVEETGQST